jgi:hypothetical protein
MNLFGFKSKKGDVLNHWIAFADRFSYPSQEFYNTIEKELEARQIPGLEKSRVEFAEGGILSEKRIYLRMLRERLVFDTCAAPFGAGYFFSCRTVYIPPVIKFWHILVLLALFCIAYSLLSALLGPTYALIAWVGLLTAIAQVFQNAVGLGLADLDATLIKVPVVGPVYERWFRKETYYRVDTRLTYLDLIPHLVQKLADEVTAAKGVKLVRRYQVAPILGELYKPVSPPEAETV